MKRVNIPGEAPGSATYDIGSGVEKYGLRLFEMEHFGDAVIREALIDTGTVRTRPSQTVHSLQEYRELARKRRGTKVYSSRFEVTYKDVDITVRSDFEAKHLTLEVDPDIDQRQKKQLTEFFEILTAPEYYEEIEQDEVDPHIPPIFRRLAIGAAVAMILSIIMDLLNIFPDLHRPIQVMKWVSIVFLCAYWVFIELKKRQMKKHWKQ